MKRICILILALVIIMGTVPAISVGAQELSDETLMIQHGFKSEIIETLPEDQKSEIVELLKTDPERIEVSNSVTQFDNLAEIEAFLAFTEDELISVGATKESLTTAKKELDTMIAFSDKELEDKYGLSSIEVKLFRKAVESGNQIKNGQKIKTRKEGTNAITTSGTISTAKLTTSQILTNNSTSTAPSYTVTNSFTWNEAYSLGTFTDELVVGWAGNMNTKSITGYARYFTVPKNTASWGVFKGDRTPEIKHTPNAGVEFKFPQSIGGDGSKARYGNFSFTLFQTKKQGYSGKIVSQYCHRTVSLLSASITITPSGPSVGLTIGPAWDTSAQKSNNFNY